MVEAYTTVSGFRTMIVEERRCTVRVVKRRPVCRSGILGDNVYTCRPYTFLYRNCQQPTRRKRL